MKKKHLALNLYILVHRRNILMKDHQVTNQQHQFRLTLSIYNISYDNNPLILIFFLLFLMNIYLDFIATMKLYTLQLIIVYFIIVQILMIFHKENQNRNFVIFMVFHEFINSIFDTFSSFMMLLRLEQL